MPPTSKVELYAAIRPDHLVRHIDLGVLVDQPGEDPLHRVPLFARCVQVGSSVVRMPAWRGAAIVDIGMSVRGSSGRGDKRSSALRSADRDRAAGRPALRHDGMFSDRWLPLPHFPQHCEETVCRPPLR